MHWPPSIAEQVHWPYISAGHVPAPEMLRKLASDAPARFRSSTEAQRSRAYPALARARSDLFGVCVVGAGGRVCAAGDVDGPFSIMSA
jgi:glutaminase